MGRNVTNIETNKAVITEDVPTTFTTVYNNTTGAAAELTGVSINGTADDTRFISSTGADEWTYFGADTVPVYQESGPTSDGFGIPYPVRLDEDRVLNFFLPHWQHRGGEIDFMDGSTIHTQILEYDTGRYRAGPISNHQLPSDPYRDASYSLWSEPNQLSGSYNQPNFRAVALSPTKVVACYRIRNMFRLMRFTITGNTVDHSIVNLDLTGASYFNTTNNYAYDLAIVPGDTDQVIVGGWASSNWSVQAFNIPDTGTLSSATSLTSTTISSTTYHFSMCEMVKTATANVTPYVIAAATDDDDGQIITMTYNSDSNTWNIPGSAVSMTRTSGDWAGIQCECLSTDTSPLAVVATVQTSTAQNMFFYRQNDGDQALNNQATLVLQHTTTKSITESYRWGDERAVFIGDCQLCVVYNSDGVYTNLIPEEESIRTERGQQQWYPFDSRPLYNRYDNNDRSDDHVPQYYSRKNVVDPKGVGEINKLGNYLPMGHDRDKCRAWNEAANCWIVGYHGRIYALDVDGNILSEVSLRELSAEYYNYIYRIADLTVTPSGRILFATLYGFGSYVNGSYTTGGRWSSSTTTYWGVTDPVTDGTKLNKTKLQQRPRNLTNNAFICNMVSFTEQTTENTTTERAFALGMQGNVYLHVWEFDGENWNNEGNTGVSRTSSSAWMEGWNPNFKLIQDTPCSLAYPSGLWRVVGSYAFSSQDNYERNGMSDAYAEGSFGSMNTTQNYISDVDDTVGYGITMYSASTGKNAGIQVAGQYNEEYQRMDVWTSIDGRLNYVRGWTHDEAESYSNNRDFAAAVGKYAYAFAFRNSSTSDQEAPIWVWNKNDIDTPESTSTANEGSGWVTLYRTGKQSFQIFADGVDETHQVAGIPDIVRFYLKLNDGSGTDFFLNNGQEIEIISEDTGLFRSTDLYNVPAGYNLQLRSDTPYTITTLLNIKEYI